MKTLIKRPGESHGKTRKRRSFLLFPLTIGLVRRWFEIAEWEEEFRCDWPYVEFPDGSEGRWVKRRWIDV